MAPLEIISTCFPSQVLNLDWNYSYIKGDTSLPILYLLHGATGNHTNFHEYTRLRRYMGELDYQGSIVFIDGFNSFYFDHNLQIETALFEELFPYVESELDHNGKRAIAGISMGGYGSLRLALKHHNYFDLAIGISSAIWENPDNELLSTWQLFNDQGYFNKELWYENHPLNYVKETNTKFYLINNKEDEITPYHDTISFYEKTKDILDIEIKIEETGSHTWIYWDKHLPFILKSVQNL